MDPLIPPLPPIDSKLPGAAFLFFLFVYSIELSLVPAT